MVRIGGGVYPEIQEKDYLSGGNLRIDSSASQTMLNSLVYKFCYYRFADATRDMGQPGFDRVRNSVIGKRDVSLRYFEEAFTSQHWMVRIYRVRTGASLTCSINRLLSQ
jgi:dolichyl-diphosphooligosaccharide--protein glycosyltransferase